MSAVGARTPASFVANRYARVYYEKADSFLHYCRPGRREPEITFHAEDVYPPPAISLVGPYLGYASRVFEGQVEDNVVVVDVRGEPPRARAGS